MTPDELAAALLFLDNARHRAIVISCQYPVLLRAVQEAQEQQVKS